MAEQFCLRWNNHQSTLVSVFENLLESETLTDCTLAAEGRYLKAHKVVLSACSPYFETILCQHYDKHPIVVLKDVKFYEMKAMLDYMYRGEVNISQDQLDAFIKTAESLQIKGLTDQGGGMGGEGDSDERDVGSTKRRGPPMKSGASDMAPESPLVGNAPLREGSTSPSSLKRRRRQRHSSQGNADVPDSHVDTSNSCDMAPQMMTAAASVPNISAAAATNSSSQPLQSTPEPGRLIKKTEPPDIIQPKIEMDEHSDDVEDLTLDDDEEYGGSSDMSKPGTSFSGPSGQDYSQWQMTGERTTDEVFMAAQEAINNQSNSQEEDDVDSKSDVQKDSLILRRRPVKRLAAIRSRDFIFYTDGIQVADDADWGPKDTKSMRKKNKYKQVLNDESYRLYREKNNESCKRSRLNRKFREFELAREAEALEAKNIALKKKVQTIEQLKNSIKDKLHYILLNKNETV